MLKILIFFVEFCNSLLATLELLAISHGREKAALLLTGVREITAVFLIYSIAVQGLVLIPFIVCGNVSATFIGTRVWRRFNAPHPFQPKS